VQVTSQDFFPTLADALGQTNAPRHDGVSLLPLLKNPKTPLNREALFWHYPHYYPRMTPASAIRADNWKLIHYYEDNRIELFNLKTDPAETNNLAATQPAQAKALRAKLDAWRKETNARAPTKNPDWRARKK
jgi:arylsulfatase A-like enzyme